jgi:hypothetical protein
MFEHYFAVLLGLGQPRGLAHSALPDAPDQPERGRPSTAGCTASHRPHQA